VEGEDAEERGKWVKGGSKGGRREEKERKGKVSRPNFNDAPPPSYLEIIVVHEAKDGQLDGRRLSAVADVLRMLDERIVELQQQEERCHQQPKYLSTNPYAKNLTQALSKQQKKGNYSTFDSKQVKTFPKAAPTGNRVGQKMNLIVFSLMILTSK